MFSPITNSKANVTANFTAKLPGYSIKRSTTDETVWFVKTQNYAYQQNDFDLKKKKKTLERNACETKSAFLYQIIS